MKTKPIILVQGGQWGSEAKGLITQKLVVDRKVDICIRTGTVNAGHTAYYLGKPYKMQQLPVGWVRPECTLVIGAGAFVHPDVLQTEIEMVNAAMPGQDVRDRLLIDHRCGLHLPFHTHLATDANRHHSMGATGKGCSEAIVDKIKNRGSRNSRLFTDWAMENCDHPLHQLHCYGPGKIVDTVDYLNWAYDGGQLLLIEGTQGTLLDLHLGPYPYVTHKQTQAASWMAEAGLSCTLPVELILVMRTFPIRVAGNSGPMPGELGWVELVTEMNQKRLKHGEGYLVHPRALAMWIEKLAMVTADLLKQTGAPPMPFDPAYWTPEEKAQYPSIASEAHAKAWRELDPPDQDELGKVFEKTTVTQKLRRIARWSPEVAAHSIMLNRPSSVALTFLNYVFPEAWGCTRVGFGKLGTDLQNRITAYVADREEELGVPVSSVGFGPLPDQTWSFYEDEL